MLAKQRERKETLLRDMQREQVELQGKYVRNIFGS